MEARRRAVDREAKLPARLVDLPDPEEEEPEVEADERRARVRGGERPEARERARGVILVEPPDGDGGLRLHAPGLELERPLVRGAGGDGPSRSLEHRSVQDPVAGAPVLRAPAKACQLLRGRERPELRRQPPVGDEERPSRRHVRMEEALGANRGGGVGLDALGGPPLALRRAPLADREEREPKVEADERAPRMPLGELFELLDRPARPRGDGRSDRGLDRARVAPENAFEPRAGGLAPAALVQANGVAEVARVAAFEERGPEVERRRLRLAPVHRRRAGVRFGALRALLLEHGTADGDTGGARGRGGYDGEDTSARRHPTEPSQRA